MHILKFLASNTMNNFGPRSFYSVGGANLAPQNVASPNVTPNVKNVMTANLAVTSGTKTGNTCINETQYFGSVPESELNIIKNLLLPLPKPKE